MSSFTDKFISDLQAHCKISGIRMDASQVSYLERALTHQQETIIADFGPLKSMLLAPFNGSTPAHVEFVSYPLLTDVGRAKVVANGASDIPVIRIELDDNKVPVVTVASAWETTWLESITPDQINLIGERRRASADANAREVDAICMIGYPTANLGGFLNNPSVPLHTLTTGSWLTATPAQILADLIGWEEFVITTSGEGGTQGNLYPNTLALPGAEVSTLLRNAGVGDKTNIWDLFTQESSQGIKQGLITGWELIRTAYAENVPTAGDRRGTMYHKAPVVLVCEVPLDIEERPAQDTGLASKNIVVSRTAGTVWKKPAMGAYAQVG